MRIEGEEVFIEEHPYDKKKRLLYVPLRSVAMIITDKLGDEIMTPDSRIAKHLLSRVKTKPLYDIRGDLDRRDKIRPSLSIAVTNDCCLRCEYCYFSAGEEGKTATMSLSDIQLAVDAYFEEIQRYEIVEADNIIHVAFAGGGEPMVKFELLKEAIRYINSKAREAGLIAHYNMPTNGVYNDDRRRFVVENFEYVSLSMDGPSDIQNYQRPFKNGLGSFGEVKKTADYFFRNGQKFAFRITVTDYSVQRLREVIDFFHENYPSIPIDMEPMSYEGRSLGNQCRVKPPDSAEYASALADAYEYAKSIGVLIKNASVGKFAHLRPYFCQAVGIPCWTVTVDKRLISCTRDSHPCFTFGRYSDDVHKFVIDRDVIAFLKNQNVLLREECRDCFMKYNCAGDCVNRRLNHEVDCDSNRAIGRQALLNRIERVNACE